MRTTHHPPHSLFSCHKSSPWNYKSLLIYFNKILLFSIEMCWIFQLLLNRIGYLELFLFYIIAYRFNPLIGLCILGEIMTFHISFILYAQLARIKRHIMLLCSSLIFDISEIFVHILSLSLKCLQLLLWIMRTDILFIHICEQFSYHIIRPWLFLQQA